MGIGVSVTMERSTTVELAVLLPDVPDQRDACVGRLTESLSGHRGISRVHVVADGRTSESRLCLHYDPGLVTLGDVQRIAARAGADLTSWYGHAVLPLRAVDTEDASRRMERVLRGLDGVLEASVSLAGQTARIEFDRREVDVERLRAALAALKYAEATALTPPGARRGLWERLRSNREMVLSLAAGLLLAGTWTAERWLGLEGSLVVVLYLGSYVLGGWDVTGHSIRSVRRGDVSFDIDLLMLVAAMGAAALGEWAEGAFLLFLFSLAHALEHLALDRARSAIRALSELAPPTARILRDGHMVDVPVEDVSAGAWVVVRPGERIPVDGSVRRGRSAVNQAPITGESVPVEKAEGDEVFAGTVNGDGALHIETTRAVGDRTLDRVIQLVEEAQTVKAPTERLAERFESVFVPVVLVSSVALATITPLVGWWDWSTAFYRSMALLVAASPCALAIGTPAAVLAGIAQAARNGVLVKGGVHLERLGAVSALALDKTGTLTVGRPEVTDLVAAEGRPDVELLTVAAAAERDSQHPLAQAVVRRARSEGIELPQAGALESVQGKGVRSSLDGAVVEIGSLRLWEGSDVRLPDEIRSHADRLAAAGRSVMAVRHGDSWLGVLGLADRPRDGVRDVLARIRSQGVDTLIMITGDNRGVARAIAEEVGIDEVEADLLPEDKVDAVRRLLARHDGVAMVGDGVNDAPALATATVGIAMGGAGTAAALETADVVLMGDDLAGIPFAIGLSRRARTTIRQNLIVSLAVIALLVLVTTTGLSGIGAAVIVHEGSSLLVVGNALRLLRFQSRGDGAEAGSRD